MASGSGGSTQRIGDDQLGPGELVFGIIAVDEDADYDLAPGAGQTETLDGWDLYPGNGINGGGGTKAGAASVDMSWTWSRSDNWAVGGVSIKSSDDTTLTKRVAAASDDAEEEGPTGTTPNKNVA